jgi:hypothetical protein
MSFLKKSKKKIKVKPPPADTLSRKKGRFQACGKNSFFPIVICIGFFKAGMSKKIPVRKTGKYFSGRIL